VPGSSLRAQPWTRASGNRSERARASAGIGSKAKCRAGALRAESPDVDMRLKSQGGKPPSQEKGRFVSTKDVTTQLATAFSTPAE